MEHSCDAGDCKRRLRTEHRRLTYDATAVGSERARIFAAARSAEGGDHMGAAL